MLSFLHSTFLYMLTMRNVTELNLQQFCIWFYCVPIKRNIARDSFLPLALRLAILFYIHTLSVSNFFGYRFALPLRRYSLAQQRPLAATHSPYIRSLYRTELNSMKMNSNWGNERLAAVLRRREWRIGECWNWTKYMGRAHVKQWLVTDYLTSFLRGLCRFVLRSIYILLKQMR